MLDQLSRGRQEPRTKYRIATWLFGLRLADAGHEPSHDPSLAITAAWEVAILDGLQSKRGRLLPVCRFSRGSDIHSRMIARRAGFSGLMVGLSISCTCLRGSKHARRILCISSQVAPEWKPAISYRRTQA
jgi:hypothetical protein